MHELAIAAAGFVVGGLYGVTGSVCASISIRVSGMRKLKIPREGFWRIAGVFVGPTEIDRPDPEREPGLSWQSPYGEIPIWWLVFTYSVWAIYWPAIIAIRAVRFRKHFRKPPFPEVRVHDSRDDPGWNAR